MKNTVAHMGTGRKAGLDLGRMLSMECGRVVVASSEEIGNASILIRRRVNEINVGKNEVHFLMQKCLDAQNMIFIFV